MASVTQKPTAPDSSPIVQTWFYISVLGHAGQEYGKICACITSQRE
jgi:hypothetical protein